MYNLSKKNNNELITKATGLGLKICLTLRITKKAINDSFIGIDDQENKNGENKNRNTPLAHKSWHTPKLFKVRYITNAENINTIEFAT